MIVMFSSVKMSLNFVILSIDNMTMTMCIVQYNNKAHFYLQLPAIQVTLLKLLVYKSMFYQNIITNNKQVILSSFVK